MENNKDDFNRVKLGVFGMSSAAWLAIAVMPYWFGQNQLGFLCSSTPAVWLTTNELATVSLGWLLMMVAMMVPMTLPSIAHIRVSTFAKRRLRATTLFLVGLGAVWLIPVMAMRELEVASRYATANSSGPAILVAVMAFIWQASPIKQSFLNRCHAHRPLSAFGFRADADALLLGLEHGLWCAGTCWALMLLMVMLPEWHLMTMITLAVLMFSERLDPPRAPAWRLRGFHTAILWLRRECHYIGTLVRFS